MKMKRIISIALVTIMIISCMPLSVLAATNVATVGGTSYTSLDAAIQAAGDGEVITLTGNCNMTSAAIRQTGNYTIDGSNRKYTVTLKNVINLNNCNVTFKGVNIVTTTPLVDYERLELTAGKSGDLVLDNCYFVAAHMGIKHCGYGNLTFKNNTLYQSNSPHGGIYFRGDHANATEDQCVITVDNSTIKHTAAADNNVNAAVLHFNSNAATYKLKLIGNAVIEHASESQTITTPSLIYGGDGNVNGSLKIYADPTAKFILSTNAPNLTGSYFTRIYSDGKGKSFNMTLYGTPQFIVSSKVAATGINMPNFTNMYSLDGNIKYTKWYNGSSLLAMNEKYVGTATTFTATALAESNSYPVYVKDADGKFLHWNSTLDYAINQVADGETIVLLSDQTHTIKDRSGISYTIDGQNRAFSVTLNRFNADGSAINGSGFLIKNDNITYKGVKFDIPAGSNFVLESGCRGDLVLDNCYIHAGNGMMQRGLGNITLTNGTLYEGSAMNSTMFYLRGDNVQGADESIITVEDSTIIQQCGAVGETQNSGIFHINPNGGGNYTFNLKGNTVIKQESTLTNAKGACIFYFQRHGGNNLASDALIYAEPSVKLILASKSTSLTEVEFIRTDYTADKNGRVQKNILRGIPQFIATANVVNQGVKMPDLTTITSPNGAITYSEQWSASSPSVETTTTVAAGVKYTGSAETRFSPIVESANYQSKAALIMGVNGEKIGTYDTLDAAIGAVADGQTIMLLKDQTQTAVGTNGISYTIDGCGRAYTLTISQQISVGTRNITYKNIKINSTGDQSFWNETGHTGDFIFDNCYITAKMGMTHRGRGNFSFINGTFYGGSAMGSTMLYMRGDNKLGENEGIITVEDSTIVQQYGRTESGQMMNAGIFHCNPRGGAHYTFNIKGNSVLKAASTRATTDQCLFYFQISDHNNYAGNATINADSTAQFILASESTSLSNSQFIRTDYSMGDNGVTQVNILNGTPKFIVNANTAKKGVMMPNVIHNSADGAIRYTNVWSVDGGTTSFTGNNKYTDASAASNITFTPVNTNLTASNSRIPFGVEKAGKVELYSSWAEIYYRRNENDPYVLVREHSLDTNIFSNVELNAEGTTWTVKGAYSSNGSKVKLTINGTGITDGTWYKLGDRQVTFENLDLVINENIDTDTTARGNSLTFNDCTIALNGAIRLVNDCKITFNNCKVNTSVGDCVFFIRNSQKDTEAVITVNNTDIIKGGPQINYNNANIFHITNTNGVSYDVKIIIKGNSRIENQGTGIENLHIFHYEDRVNTDSRCTLEVEGDDVVFALNPQGASLKDGMFIKIGTGRRLDMIGMPKFEMNALAVNSGAKFFGGHTANYNRVEGGELIGAELTTASGEKLIVPNAIKAGTINEDITSAELKFIYPDSGFDMIDGAAIRKQHGSGIRFSTVVSGWLYKMTNDHDIEFGTIIASEDRRGGTEVNMALAETTNAVYIKTVKWVDSDANDDNNDMLYRAALIDIPDTAKAYEKRLAGRSVMTINYDDGTVGYFYSDFGNNNIRSMYDVADRLDKKGLGDKTTQQILDTVIEPITTPLADEVKAPEKSIDIYIIAGQSNASGFTTYNTSELSALWPSYATGVSNIKYTGRAEGDATNTNEVYGWENAKAGQGYLANRMGPEVGMAYALSTYYTGDKEAGIIKFAHGGTSLLKNLDGENAVSGNWMSPSYAEYLGLHVYGSDSNRKYHGGHGGLYMGLVDQVEFTIERLRLDGYTDINIKGVFWMQGESDRSYPAEYKKAFKYFAADLREDIGDIVGEDMSALPIIVGEISKTTGSAVASNVTTNNNFITAQRALANEVNNVYVINSSQYDVNTLVNGESKPTQDGWHWTTEPMFRIGEMVGTCIKTNILA